MVISFVAVIEYFKHRAFFLALLCDIRLRKNLFLHSNATRYEQLLLIKLWKFFSVHLLFTLIIKSLTGKNEEQESSAKPRKN